MERYTIAALTLALAAAPAGAQEWTSSRPDGHAPIGVMGDHMHERGEMMLSYRFMFMNMEDNRIDTETVPIGEVLDDFMVAPEKMTMQMHMLGLMVAPSDAVTLMLMLPYTSIEMDHVTRMGGTFTTEGSGIGDVKFGGMVRLFNANRMAAHLNLFASAPTGDIDVMDVTPASGAEEVRLPYPMQIGSGTFDLMPGVTLLGQSDAWSWGAQAKGTFRLGENDNDYRLSHVGLGTAWAAWRVSDRFSFSGRLEGTVRGDIEGEDPELNPLMVPTADPTKRDGTRVDGLVGINFSFPPGALTGHRLAAEWGMPLYQDLGGPQLETDWRLWIGWQWAFDVWH